MKNDLKDFDPLNLPYSDESDYIYIYNRKFNISIVIEKRQPNETNNDLIYRINQEINRRFDLFESKIKEYNRFSSLSKKEQEKEAIKEQSRWGFKHISKSGRKEIIDRYILYKSEIPKL